MKISPLSITKSNILNKIYNLCHKVRFTNSGDSFELRTEKPFETLTLSTFEKLRRIKYTPEKLDGYLSTFVIDKKTLKPVTVFVKQTSNDNNGHEQYYFYVKNKRTKEFERLGHRDFFVYGSNEEIYPCYMMSFKKEKYLGIGIREHQITVERMQQVGAPNIRINSTADAKPFHEKCGFEPSIPGRMHLSEKALKEWDIFINSGQKIIV